MGTHLIEVNDRVFKYLQSHAEPLIDTPNSVLIKLLFDEERIVIQTKKPSISVSGLPKSLAYVLEVISEIERCLKPKGKAIIALEPNKWFYRLGWPTSGYVWDKSIFD